MSEYQPVTVLHLSDLQFGKNHRFSGDYDTLLRRVLDDLRGLEGEAGLRPDLIILTGDLAEWGRKSEFQDVLKFITGMAEALNLRPDRIVVVPGNHDIDRDACEGYFKDSASDEEDPKPPYWRKWEGSDLFWRNPRLP